MIICPNLKNPEVAREFNELVLATSEAAAYHIWSLNNGNAIDKAPNGAESKLFSDLLLLFNGDRTKAIRAKAKVYGNSFLNWFGNWIFGDKEGNFENSVSKVVDENGEPLIVYHNSSLKFNEFDAGYIGSGGGFWFTTLRGEYENYIYKYEYPSFLKMNNPYDEIAYINSKYGENAFEEIRDYLWRESNIKPNYPDDAWIKVKMALNDYTQASYETDMTPFYYRSRDTREEYFKYGFDGETDGIYYVVFNPNQIKSATGDKLSFEDTNDIRFKNTTTNLMSIESEIDGSLQQLSQLGEELMKKCEG